MMSDRKLANTMGGKTARACDNCIKKRARWYCAADDAFLCQGCDSSVHSANPLARRHERVYIKAAPLIRQSREEASLEDSLPSWHHGFTRKARTPRSRNNINNKSKSDEQAIRNPLHLVPELFSDETSHEENEEQLLYRVPSFDPYVTELSTSLNNDCSHVVAQFHGSLPSEMDLAEFAADVESLLGKGLDDESFDMEGLGFMDCKEKNLMSSKQVKVENDEGEIVVAHEFYPEFDVPRGQFELSFYDSNSMVICEDEGKVEGESVIISKGSEFCDESEGKKKMVICLRLDYDGIVTAWDEQRSPWTNGERPQFDSYECWPYCMGTCGRIHHIGDISRLAGHRPTVATDGGREARLSRYREKRRTRLYSTKIRYEVRKLNAEKRPRMKGRFVKKANFALG